MAELKPEVQKNVGPKIEQKSTDSAPLIAPQVSFTPVRIIPSGIAEAAAGISRGLAGMAGRNVKADKISGILSEVKAGAEKRIEEMKAAGGFDADLYNREVRNKLYDDALAAGRANGLDAENMERLINQTKFLMTDQFPVDLVTTVTDAVTGVKTTKFRGDIVGSEFDTDGVLAANMAVINEHYPAQARELLMLAAGYQQNDDGTVSKLSGSPEEIRVRKSMAEQVMIQTLMDKAALENSKFELDKIETAVGAIEGTNKKNTALAVRRKSIMVQKYQSMASSKLGALMLQNNGALLSQPPEAGLAQYRELLAHQRGSLEFLEFETALQDRTILDAAQENAIKTAELLFKSGNLKTIKEFNVEWQEAAMKFIANEALINQGAVAVSLYQNAEKFQQLMGAAISANAFAKTPGAADTPMGATILGLTTANGIDSVKGRLAQMQAMPEPARNTDSVAVLVEGLRKDIKALLTHSENGSGMSMTPFGILESINEIKSSPAMERWLSSRDVPIADRERVIKILNAYEESVTMVSGLTQDDLKKLRKKSWKPHEYFQKGIPADLRRGSDVTIEE